METIRPPLDRAKRRQEWIAGRGSESKSAGRNPGPDSDSSRVSYLDAPGVISVFGRPFDGLYRPHIHTAARALEPQTQLFLQCRRQRRHRLR